MNQVEFLGLTHTFAIESPSSVQNILHQTHSEMVQIRIRKVLRNNYQSCNLIDPDHFWRIHASLRNSTSFTRLFLAGRRARAGHETTLCVSMKVKESHLMNFFTPLDFSLG